VFRPDRELLWARLPSLPIHRPFPLKSDPTPQIQLFDPELTYLPHPPMRARFHPEKTTSQIVFDSPDTDQPFKTMSLETIPNKPHRQITGKDSFPAAPPDSPDPLRAKRNISDESSGPSSPPPLRRRGGRVPPSNEEAPFARDYSPLQEPAAKCERPARDIMKVDDIEGACAGSTIKRSRVRRSTGGDESPSSILMIPSMAQQGKQLEREQAVRNLRGEQVRAYEGRNTHFGTESGPEASRNGRDSGARHDTF
jgi:hypothetical protein